MPGKSYRGELPPADDALLSLADELRRDVSRLAVDIGERNVRNRPQALAQAADWIEAEFRAAGFAAERQEYQVSGRTSCNLEARMEGRPNPRRSSSLGCTTTRFRALLGQTTIPVVSLPPWPWLGDSPAARSTGRSGSWRS